VLPLVTASLSLCQQVPVVIGSQVSNHAINRCCTEGNGSVSPSCTKSVRGRGSNGKETGISGSIGEDIELHMGVQIGRIVVGQVGRNRTGRDIANNTSHVGFNSSWRTRVNAIPDGVWILPIVSGVLTASNTTLCDGLQGSGLRRSRGQQRSQADKCQRSSRQQ